MKNTLLIPFLILSCATLSESFGQNYYPLPDSNAQWTIAAIQMGNFVSNETYTIGGDTIINSLSYHKILTSAQYFCAVREENKKWYFVEKELDVEHALYDFNAVTGDTIAIYNPFIATSEELKVMGEDSVLIGNTYRRRLSVTDLDGHFPDKWIEGIGSGNGLFYPAFNFFDVAYQLLCFSQNDSLLYINSPNDSCHYIYIGIHEKEMNSSITISTINSSSLQVVLNHPTLFIRSVRLFNTAGTELASLQLSANARTLQLNSGSLSRGLYLCSVTLNNGTLLTKKIVTE